jgi:membrane-bound lytic murein transglycosylase MltF
MMHESGGRNIMSPSGAIGPMQLMPSTARAMGVTDIWNPEQNVAGGGKYLTQLMMRYSALPKEQQTAAAVAAYNAGPGQVDALLKGTHTRFADPHQPLETESYTGKVLGSMGYTGDVSIGAVTIHIQEPRAGHKEIVRAVSDGVQEAMNKKTQRNLQEFQSQSWSY